MPAPRRRGGVDLEMHPFFNRRRLLDLWATARPRLRFAVRATVVALLAFVLASFSNLPLHGIWAVLTAIVVTQMSAGGSVRASAEYMVGTLAGAIYAGALGVLIPHESLVATAGVLALAIAPLAFASAAHPSFRAAPFSAVLVLLIAGQLGEGTVQSGLLRIAEVALGAAIAVAVSFLVFPARAHSLARESSARTLREMARVLPQLLRGCVHRIDPAEITRVQDALGAAVSNLQTIAADATSERFFRWSGEPDEGPLSRTLLRIRHDFVIIGRSALTPLPAPLSRRLAPRLTRAGSCASDFLLGCATALALRAPPPPLDDVEAALGAFATEFETARLEGVTLRLGAAEAEQVFAIGFALEQLHGDLRDLDRCVREHARRMKSGTGATRSGRA
jgi:hypothetical protein